MPVCECSKSISRYDDSIACQGKCGYLFHLECAHITQEEYTALNEVGEINKWICYKCSNRNLTSNVKEGNRNLHNVLNPHLIPKNISLNDEQLTQLIQDAVSIAIDKFNCEIVKPLMAELKHLKNQNEQLLQKIETHGSFPIAPRNAEIPKTYAVAVTKSKPTNKQTGSSDKSKIFKAVSEIPKCTLNEIEVQNITTNNNQGSSNEIPHQAFTDDSEWQKIKSKRNKAPTLITGTNNTDPTLKGVIKKITFHVSRLHPNTSIKDISDHLITKDISDTVIEQLSSKHPELYSSFKVSISPQFKEAFLSRSTWLKGIMKIGLLVPLVLLTISVVFVKEVSVLIAYDCENANNNYTVVSIQDVAAPCPDEEEDYSESNTTAIVIQRNDFKQQRVVACLVVGVFFPSLLFFDVLWVFVLKGFASAALPSNMLPYA
ncbi:hypothetical protein FQR65_LT17477 [Abscondita terminalis]|nr:hypothetical protein FQR65_LT17477 [Abscondita terminalis]